MNGLLARDYLLANLPTPILHQDSGLIRLSSPFPYSCGTAEASHLFPHFHSMNIYNHTSKIFLTISFITPFMLTVSRKRPMTVDMRNIPVPVGMLMDYIDPKEHILIP